MSILNFRRKPKAVAPVLIVPPEPQTDWEAMYRAKEADYNEVIEQLEIARAAGTGLAEVIKTQSAIIENLKQEPERLASTMANIAEREEALRRLSIEAIRLLLQPGGMRLPWQAKRAKLIEEYRAIGIEGE